MRLSSAICIVLMLKSCAPLEETAGEAKFIAGVQDKDYRGNYWITRNREYMVEKVHDASLDIVIGFEDDDARCGGKYEGGGFNALWGNIKKSLRLWFSPLRKKYSNVVDTFNYRVANTTFFRVFGQKTLFIAGDAGDRDLDIIFYCQTGRSYFYFGWKPNEIHMFYDVNEDGDTWHDFAALTHELGHALGLGDTYTEASKGWATEGGSDYTRGTQPIAIMNRHYHSAHFEGGEMHLSNDDVAGVEWLYRYHVLKDIGLNDCPDEYEHEASTGGCVPKFPLIFAVKTGDWATVADILRSDETISVNPKDGGSDKSISINDRDDRGNTALHYAAEQLGVRGDKMYSALVNREADKEIPNDDGDTAEDLFVEALVEWAKLGKPSLIVELLVYAYYNGDNEVITRFFASTNIDINLSGDEQTTILHRLIQIRYRDDELPEDDEERAQMVEKLNNVKTELVKRLLVARSDVDFERKDGADKTAGEYVGELTEIKDVLANYALNTPPKVVFVGKSKK